MLEARIPVNREGIHGKGRRTRIQPPHRDERSAQLRRAGEVSQSGAHYRVDDDVDAHTVGVASGSLGDTVAVRTEHGGRARTQERVLLVRATRDGERDGAELVRNLDGRQAHTTRRSGDQDMVPRSHRGLLDQRPVGGGVRHPQRRGTDRVDAVGPRDDPAGRHDRVLGIRPANVGIGHRGDDDLVADHEAFDARTDCIDGASALDAQAGVGQPDRSGILPRAHHLIEPIDPECLDLDSQFGRARFVDWLVDDPQHIGSAKLIEHDNSCHRRPSPSSWCGPNHRNGEGPCRRQLLRPISYTLVQRIRRQTTPGGARWPDAR